MGVVHKVADKIYSKIKDGNEKIVINDEMQHTLINALNESLKENKQLLINKIFNAKIDVDEIKIVQYNPIESFVVSVEYQKYEFSYQLNSADSAEGGVRIGYSFAYDNLEEKKDEMLKDLTNDITINVMWRIFAGKISYRFIDFLIDVLEPTYLPASRTGFMLTYKDVVRKTIKKRYEYNLDDNESKDKSIRLGLPTSRFLQKLINRDQPEKIEPEIKNVIDFLETDVIKGHITEDDSQIPNYLYKPIHSNAELPLHLTSSVVAELAPLILFLKSQYENKLLIIEEPEAHLHPELQRKLARALIRLVNTGRSVWTTTHGDTMFQQFNNLIHLSDHPKKSELLKEFNYSEEDVLKSRDLARAYQFEINESGETVVNELEMIEEGFSVPTFNKSIYSLSKETIQLQESREDGEED